MDKKEAIRKIEAILKDPSKTKEDNEGLQYLTTQSHAEITKIAKEAGLTRKDMREISVYWFGDRAYPIGDSKTLKDAKKTYSIRWRDTYYSGTQEDKVTASSLTEALRKIADDLVGNADYPGTANMKIMYASSDDGIVYLRAQGKDFKTAMGMKLDSVVNDGLSLFVQNYLASKKVNSKQEQDEIIKFLLERKKITEKDILAVRKALKFKAKNNSTDSLKSYKIKNHETGKTYKVKAKTFKDAKEKYENFIKDSLSESDKEIVNTSVKRLKKEGKPVTSENVISDLNKNMAGFVGKNKDDIIKYIDKFTGDSDDYKGYTIIKSEGGWKVKINGDIMEFPTDKEAKEYIDTFVKDSFKEDADIAQNSIKELFLNEADDADKVKYIGFNDDRKISFYEYGDSYFAYFDLEGRTEKITKEEVQRILKKNLISETEKEKEELFPKEKEGIAQTERNSTYKDSKEYGIIDAEDYSISVEQFNPERLVKSVQERRTALHNYVKLKDETSYFIAMYADFISVVRIDKDGKQKRVVDEDYKSPEEAVNILNKVKSQLQKGGYR